MARRRFRTGHSVFWRVAAAFIAVQLTTGLLAIGLSAYLASDRSLELAVNSMRVRLDALAEEIERAGAPLDQGVENLPAPLLSNLSFRFPDPLLLVDAEGRVLQTVYPDPGAFDGNVADTTSNPSLPPDFVADIAAGVISVETGSSRLEGGWASAPLYDASGLLVGGYAIQPIERTLARELAPTRRAFRTAMWSVVTISVLLAVILAAVFTWWLVRPLRKITSRVAEIGAGDYEARVDVRGTDEFAQLGTSVNQMADQVSESIDALRTTDRLRRELVANVGHDLRTPLAAIHGYIEEGLRFYSEQREAEGVKAFESAQNQAVYLQRLVDDLFELSILENPTPELRLETILLTELLNEAVRNHTGRMATNGIDFQVEIPGTLPIIEADSVRLMRLLDNILSNSLRHTNEGDWIRLSAELTSESIEISIKDSGEGMDAESLRRIFDRYYRGEASRTRDGRGTGLGLAISRAVAQLHGGTLTAESTVGVGTTMVLNLPLDLIQNKRDPVDI